jgi:hypothetical protein
MVVIDDLQLQPGVASISSQHRPGLLRSGTQAPFPVCPGKGSNANPQKASGG